MTRDAGLRMVLRSVAIAIAVASIADPVMTRSRPAPRTVVVAQLASASVASVESAIRQGLPNAEVAVRPVTDRRLPCAPGETCVIAADGSVDVDVPQDLPGPVSLIRLGLPAGPNVAVTSVAAPRSHHGAGSGVLRVTLAGSGVSGRRTDVRVTDGAATVGSAGHEWKQDGDAVVDVPWWPLGEGGRALRVTAVPFDGEASAIDNGVDVGVSVSASPIGVLMFDARPSWAGTFVRRALEDDSRFRVEHRAGLGPALAAGTVGGRLDARALDAVSVAIIGSPNGLSEGEVALLERFVGTRGGTLVLLPDGAPSGASARLFSGRWSEHLEASPSAAGPLRASETLRLADASRFDLVLGTVKGAPAIVLAPTGNGRIVVSGAMDAWRYREADGGAFDRFWRSLVFESAANSSSLTVSLARPMTAPGTQLPFTVRHRQMDPGSQRTAIASATCGDGSAHAVRLWPEGAAGVFAGVMPVDGDQPCELRVEMEGSAVTSAGVAVTTGATATVAEVADKLERFAIRTGGVVTNSGETTVTSALALALAQPAVPVPFHPMRSPWWMSPFVACLGVEWWLRRRAGLR
jgi:hypothetical protein